MFGLVETPISKHSSSRLVSSIISQSQRPDGSKLYHRATPKFAVLVAEVVMEIEEDPASSRGDVAMEIPTRDAIAVAVQGAISGDLEPEERSGVVQHLGQHLNEGPPFCQRSYYMLIVIGEIATEHQLRAVREHIEQGERLLLQHH